MVGVKLELSRRREECDLSKQRLSFMSQVPATVIGQIESGRFVPYEPQLRRIAKALGVPAAQAASLLQPVSGDPQALD